MCFLKAQLEHYATIADSGATSSSGLLIPVAVRVDKVTHRAVETAVDDMVAASSRRPGNQTVRWQQMSHSEGIFELS